MSLPRVAPYAIPSPPPTDRAGWELVPGRAALLVHDMQRYFMAAYDSAREPVPELLANISRLLEACRAQGIPVFYSAQPGGQPDARRGMLREVWGPGLRDDPEHTAIVEDLTPVDGDHLLQKWRYSAFVRTDLAEVLNWLGRDQLVVCGVYAHLGCLLTAADAFMRDLQPFMVSDAVADFSLEDHEYALRYAATRCARVLTTDEVVDAVV